MIQPFQCYSAPTCAQPHGKLLLIGEAPGEEEERAGIPFVGAAGGLLSRLCSDAGFTYYLDYNRGGKYSNQRGRFDLVSEFHITNVFSLRPPKNDLLQWCSNKTELKRQDRNYNQPVMGNGKYLRPEYLPHLARLRCEIGILQPDLIIGFGAVALWALTGNGKIGTARGVFLDLPSGKGIFTFHPANILRQYENYPLAWRDLTKARSWLNGELTPPLARRLCINPTWEEMEEHLAAFAREPQRPLGVDIETDPRIDQITTVAFGWPEKAICIPFYNKETLAAKCQHWPSVEEEYRAWAYVKKFARLPNPKVMQNGLYDMQYLLDEAGVILHNVTDDTAILQHSLQPELKKDLGTLASVYLNEPLWKYLRTSAKDDNKADD